MIKPYQNQTMHIFPLFEMALEEAKSTVDTEKSSWRALLEEFENEGFTDTYINGHTKEKNTAEGGEPSYAIRESCMTHYHHNI